MPLAVLVGLVELALVAATVFRVLSAAKELRQARGDDVLARVGALTDPLMRLVGTEVAIVYYAVVGPWLRPPPRRGEFGYVRSGALEAFVFGGALLLLMEGIGAHFVLRAWSPFAARAHALVCAYALVWLWASLQAARLRPVLLCGDRLLVRTSVLWTVDVPRARIADVALVDVAPRRARVLRAAVGAPPVLLLELSAPVVAQGPFGVRRTVDAIALHVDEPVTLREALLTHTGAGPADSTPPR